MRLFIISPVVTLLQKKVNTVLLLPKLISKHSFLIMQKKQIHLIKSCLRTLANTQLLFISIVITLYLVEHAKKSVCRFEIYFETPCDFVLSVAMAGWLLIMSMCVKHWSRGREWKNLLSCGSLKFMTRQVLLSLLLSFGFEYNIFLTGPYHRQEIHSVHTQKKPTKEQITLLSLFSLFVSIDILAMAIVINIWRLRLKISYQTIL